MGGNLPAPRHALPAGPERRRRRRGSVRGQVPTILALFTGLTVAEGSAGALQGSVGGQVLDVFRIALVGALTAVVLVVAVLLPIEARAEKLKASRARPRPRVQYVLISAGWLCLSACLALAATHAGTGYLSRACLALALWFGVLGLAMSGRAMCWGRLRNLFWWHGPTWLADEEATDTDTQHAGH